MKIAIYCRVSTQEQALHGESLQDQQQAIKRWAIEKKYEICGIYIDEGISAHIAYRKRPALMRLLESVEKNEIQLIAFTKFDRWTRKAADYYKLQEILDKHNVAWTAILEDYSTATADGRFKVGIMLSVNQHEAERTSDRIKFTLAEKRKRGEIISGHMPRGYILVDGKPIKDPVTAPGYERFFKDVLDGMSMNKMVERANEYGCNLTIVTASHLIKAARKYTGSVQCIPVEPYITEEQAEKIVNSTRKRPRSVKTTYLFSGLTYCAECGSRCAARNTRQKRMDGTYSEWRNYTCKKHFECSPKQCANGAGTTEKKIEKTLLDGIIPALEQYEVQAKKSRSESNVEAIEQKIARLEARKKRAWEAYLDGAVEKADFEEQRKKSDEEIKMLQEQVQHDRKQDSLNSIREELPPGWKDIYFSLNDENKAKFWHRIIGRIEIDSSKSVTFSLKE